MKFIKRIALAGVATLLIGAIITVVALGVLGFNVDALDAGEYKFDRVTEETLGGKITAVEADLSNLRIKIEKGNGFALDYFTTEDYCAEYEFDEKTGVFKIKAYEKLKGSLRLNFFEGIKKNDCYYTFTVPDGVSVKFDCKNSVAETDDVKTEEFYLSAVNSDIELDGADIAALTVKATNSSLKTEECTVRKFVFDGTNSSLKTEDGTVGELSYSGQNDSFKGDKTTFGSVKFTGNNSGMKITESRCDEFDLSGNNSSFDIAVYGKKSDFESIKMTGGNASFKVDGEKFDGEYSGFGTKKFSFHGNNTSVKLRFE